AHGQRDVDLELLLVLDRAAGRERQRLRALDGRGRRSRRLRRVRLRVERFGDVGRERGELLEAVGDGRIGGRRRRRGRAAGQEQEGQEGGRGRGGGGGRKRSPRN